MIKVLKKIPFVLLIACTAVMILAISPKSTMSDAQIAGYAKIHTPEDTASYSVDQPVYGANNTNAAYEQELIQHQKNVQHEIDRYYSSLPKDAGSGNDPVPDIMAPGQIIQRTVDQYYSSLPREAGSGNDPVPDLFAPGQIIQRTIDHYFSSLPREAGSGEDPVPDILTGPQLMQRAIDEYFAKH